MDSNNEVWRDLKIDQIREDIILKYGSLAECAKALGVASQQLSRWLKKPSEKFYLLLIKNGVLQGEGHHDQPKREFIMDELNKIIEEQGKIIQDQRKMLDNYSVVFEMMKEIRAINKDKEVKEKTEEYLLAGKQKLKE